MNVIVELCVVPLGVGTSIEAYVAACQQVLEEAGLQTQTHAYGTNVEGDWDAVFAAVKRCHQLMHEMGAPRIFSTVKIGTRAEGVPQTIERVVQAQP